MHSVHAYQDIMQDVIGLEWSHTHPDQFLTLSSRNQGSAEVFSTRAPGVTASLDLGGKFVRALSFMWGSTRLVTLANDRELALWRVNLPAVLSKVSESSISIGSTVTHDDFLGSLSTPAASRALLGEDDTRKYTSFLGSIGGSHEEEIKCLDWRPRAGGCSDLLALSKSSSRTQICISRLPRSSRDAKEGAFTVSTNLNISHSPETHIFTNTFNDTLTRRCLLR
jgi:hypothetical protein